MSIEAFKFTAVLIGLACAASLVMMVAVPIALTFAEFICDKISNKLKGKLAK